MPPLRYIESFDTVRHDSVTRSATALAQAELELIIGLLFGERMVVHGSMSFDSRAFLSIASKIIPAPDLARHSPVRRPFELALIPSPNFANYSELVSYQFSRTHNEFILSGWSEISRDDRRRKLISEAMASGNFDIAHRELRDFREELEQIERLGEYFGSHRPRVAEPARKSLQDHIEAFANISNDEIKSGSFDRARKIPQKLRELLDANAINFKNRTDIRVKGNQYFTPDQLQLVIEFIDSAYNRVIAESVGASVCVFSTGGDARDQDVFSGELIANIINSSIAPQDEIQSPYVLEIDKDRLTLGGLEKSTSTDSFWQHIWPILSDEDWIDSVDKLHSAKSRTEIEEQIERHIQFLASAISQTDLGPKHWSRPAQIIVGAASGAAIGQAFDQYMQMKFSLPGLSLILAAFGSAVGTTLSTLVPSPREYVSRGSIERALRSDIRVRHLG